MKLHTNTVACCMCSSIASAPSPMSFVTTKLGRLDRSAGERMEAGVSSRLLLLAATCWPRSVTLAAARRVAGTAASVGAEAVLPAVSV